MKKLLLVSAFTLTICGCILDEPSTITNASLNSVTPIQPIAEEQKIVEYATKDELKNYITKDDIKEVIIHDVEVNAKSLTLNGQKIATEKDIYDLNQKLNTAQLERSVLRSRINNQSVNTVSKSEFKNTMTNYVTFADMQDITIEEIQVDELEVHNDKLTVNGQKVATQKDITNVVEMIKKNANPSNGISSEAAWKTIDELDGANDFNELKNTMRLFFLQYANPTSSVIKLQGGESVKVDFGESTKYKWFIDNGLALGKDSVWIKHPIEVSFPPGLKNLDQSSFRGAMMLKEVSLPNSITNIGAAAFYYCQNIKEIKLPKNLKSIGASAFNFNTRLQSIEIPTRTETIGSYAFYRCTGLTNVVINAQQVTIGENAFKGCTLAKFKCSPQVKEALMSTSGIQPTQFL